MATFACTSSTGYVGCRECWVHGNATQLNASRPPCANVAGSGQHAATFNAHAAGATGLAVYGCGILAAAHVGGLKALERHGLDYSKIETLAGVSAGSVVVAMLAVDVLVRSSRGIDYACHAGGALFGLAFYEYCKLY